MLEIPIGVAWGWPENCVIENDPRMEPDGETVKRAFERVATETFPDGSNVREEGTLPALSAAVAHDDPL